MKKYLFFSIIPLFAIACQSVSSKHDDELDHKVEVVISAQIETLSSPMKVSGKGSDPNNPAEGVIELTWDIGDQIMVTTEYENAIFRLKEGEGTKYALFKGDVSPKTESYSVVYPTNYTDKVLYNQTYIPNGFGKDLIKLSTREDGTVKGGFTLVVDNALLGLQIKGQNKLNKIVLTNSETEQTYTLTCPTIQLTADQPILFYIVVPAEEWQQGFTVDLYNHNNILIERFKKTSPAIFEAGKAMIMPISEITYEYVDLGLSVKWATCNVGASVPEEYGEYFAFGEIVPQPYRTYLWMSYAHCKGTSKTLTKYNTNPSYGYNNFVDGLTTLLPEDDAANINWTNEWRIPTRKELLELKNNCTWVETTLSGVTGHLVTSKKEGYSDRSIFLPFSGVGYNNCLTQLGSEGNYACSEIHSSNETPYYAMIIHINRGNVVEWRYNRERGISIRPVCP